MSETPKPQGKSALMARYSEHENLYRDSLMGVVAPNYEPRVPYGGMFNGVETQTWADVSPLPEEQQALSVAVIGMTCLGLIANMVGKRVRTKLGVGVLYSFTPPTFGNMIVPANIRVSVLFGLPGTTNLTVARNAAGADQYLQVGPIMVSMDELTVATKNQLTLVSGLLAIHIAPHVTETEWILREPEWLAAQWSAILNSNIKAEEEVSLTMDSAPEVTEECQ